MAFEFESRVRYSETGPDQKLTLVSLVDYFQDSSTFQSEDCGAGMNYLYEHDAAWMILSWQIDILRRPVLGKKFMHRRGRTDLRCFMDTGIMRFSMQTGIILRKQTVSGC